jgi:hypothetical protein
MVEPHPVFEEPKNEEIKIWRYMDFTKFISLIDTKRLFFTRADKFKDPFEGSYPNIDFEDKSIYPSDLLENEKEGFIKAVKGILEMGKQWPRYTAINCWHMNEYESAAMWSLYLKSNEGIAIQTTFKKLKHSIIDEEKVYLGMVKYINYEKEIIDPTNTFRAFLHKRISFEHERELRAIIYKPPVNKLKIEKNNKIPLMDFKTETINQGLSIEVDIKELIEKIYVAPSAPLWLIDLIKNVISKYGYDFNIIQSKLYDAPIY